MRSYFAGATLLAIILSATACATHPGYEVVASAPLFSRPECVVWDEASRAFYVSSIDGAIDRKDGSGFISKVDERLEPVDLRWVEGLDAPKGMHVSGGFLYVTDIDRIVVIDIASGDAVRFVSVPGAEFLNDAIALADGTIVASDSKKGALFLIGQGGGVAESSLRLRSANGLAYDGGRVYVGAGGDILEYSPADDRIVSTLVKGCGNVDGLAVSGGRVVYSNYFSAVCETMGGRAEAIFRGVPFIDFRADLCVLPDGTIAVADFKDSVLLYRPR